MASSSRAEATGYGLNIGCEIETLLSLRGASGPRVELATLANILCERFEQERDKDCAKLHPNMEGNTFNGPMYSTWTLTEDSTIKKAKEDGIHVHPLELVSPMMTFGSQGTWRNQIGDMFDNLLAFTNLKGNQSCGFHIHLSPVNRQWMLSELKLICKAIIHFERAMAALLPPHRNGSFWAKTHSNNVPHFEGKSVGDCIRLIGACKDIDALVRLMNEGSNRYYAWNFQNLDEQKTGTIEWRQPAAITTARGCTAWMELAITFVQAARKSDIDCTTYAATVEGLYSFILNGVINGVSDQRYLETIFNSGKMSAGSAELVRPRIPPAAELAAKVKEDQKKNLMLKKLNEKLRAQAKAAAAKKAAQAGGAGGGRN